MASFFATLFIGSAIISSLSVAFVLMRQPAAPRPLWLILLLIVAAGFLGVQTVVIGRLQLLNEHFYYPPLNYTFAIGPALYFYVRKQLQPARGFQPRDWLHWIAPIFQIVVMTTVSLVSIPLKYQFYQQVDLVWYGTLHMVWTYGNVIVYGVTVWLMLRQVRNSAEITPTTASWLRALTFAVLFSVFSALLLERVLPPVASQLLALDLTTYAVYRVIPVVLISLALFWISANAYLYTLQSRTVVTPVHRPTVRRETYAIDDAQLKENASRLAALMASEQLYRDPELTLRSLASRLDLTSQQLSYVINEATGQNFNSYINQRRTEAAKGLLGDPSNRHRSVLELGFEAGFSSKSTFNRVFKEMVGCSPSQFRVAQPTD